MIGILQNKGLTAKKMRENLKWHWERAELLIRNCRDTNGNGEGIADLERAIAPYSFKDVATADHNALKKLKDKLDHERIARFQSGKEHFFVKLYQIYRRKYGKELCERLELTVCPYCNRNYINSGMNYTTAQLDHFLPKSVYPIFALSLYNLIPCCSVCNHKKQEKDFGYSPYDGSKTTDELLTFGYRFDQNGEVRIDLKAQKDFRQNAEVLQLEKLYEVHKNLAKEIIVKRVAYPKAYLRGIEKLFEEAGMRLDMTAEEIYFGNYLSEENYYLRPLSKFTHDVLKQTEK